MYKKHAVVMLPTEKASHIILRQEPHFALNCYPVAVDINQTALLPQHLYFLSDEEIKEGDWYLDLDIDIVSKFSKGDKFDIEVLKRLKKIIVSTDKSLGLPRPSDSFIKKYCESGGIDEVMVEYVEITAKYDDEDIENTGDFILKIAPDNTITIKKGKR